MITAGCQPLERSELFHLLHALIRSLVGQAAAGCFIGETPNVQKGKNSWQRLRS